MAACKKKRGGTGRREFLTGTGAALTVGMVTGITGDSLAPQVEAAEIPVAARIEHHASLCAGCGVCSLMCSLYHEKVSSLVLSRSEIIREPLEGTFSLNVCRQCQAPSCYQACPLKDSALCVDKETGIKYINAAKCSACGECVRACPLDPPRVRLTAERKHAYKCDLCRGRENGPICVEYCGQHALAAAPGNRRA